MEWQSARATDSESGANSLAGIAEAAQDHERHNDKPTLPLKRQGGYFYFQLFT
jgi:hypothetical protein